MKRGTKCRLRMPYCTVFIMHWRCTLKTRSFDSAFRRCQAYTSKIIGYASFKSSTVQGGPKTHPAQIHYIDATVQNENKLDIIRMLSELITIKTMSQFYVAVKHFFCKLALSNFAQKALNTRATYKYNANTTRSVQFPKPDLTFKDCRKILSLCQRKIAVKFPINRILLSAILQHYFNMNIYQT